MAPTGMEKELNLLLDCIRYGELKVNWAAIDKKNGCKNKNPGGTSKMAFYMLQKKYGLQKAAGQPTGGQQQVFSQGCGTKRGLKREAPTEAEDGSKGRKKAKGEANKGGCKGETGGENKN